MNQREIISGPGVTSGPETGVESGREIKGVTEQDLRIVLPKIGETTMVLQRNAKDERDPQSPNYGSLTPEAAEKTRTAAKHYFGELFSKLTPEEKSQLEILVIASDATLAAPEGPEFSSPKKRGLETAARVIEGAKDAMDELGVPKNQLLNLSEFSEESEPEGAVEFKDLEALQILSQSREFVEHLKNKYGTGKNFWIAYEADKEKEKREELHAEGVSEISERMRAFIKLLSQGGIERHSRLKGKRLIIWAVTHYDALSPYIKVNILKRPATDYLPINAGAGITLEIDGDGKARTELSGQNFNVKL